jgi:hypothetical protein
LIDSFPTVDEALEKYGLKDPLKNFADNNQVRIKSELFDDYQFLVRNLTISVFMAFDSFSISGLSIDSKSVSLKTLNSFVQVKCGNSSKCTFVIKDNQAPAWNEKIRLQIKIPCGSLYSIEEWVDKQNVEFLMYDEYDTGTEQWHTLVAVGFIPLSRALLSTKKPLSAIITMMPISSSGKCTNQPKLEVAIHDTTKETWAWAKVADHYVCNETWWRKTMSDKFENDIRNALLRTDFSRTGAEDFIWEMYKETFHGITRIFPYRQFRFVALDENNSFRFLCQFIQPLLLNIESKTCLEISRAISNIPYLQHSEESPPQVLIESWLLKGSIGSYFQETFRNPISFISTILTRKSASLLERAILMCSLFLGQKVNAFVAIGECIQN